MNIISGLTVTRGNHPIPRSTEARKLKINQYRIPKPRLNSRSGALTWKAIYFDLGPIPSDKISGAMKELEQYLGATYSEI